MKMTFALPDSQEVTAYFDQELLELLRQNGLGGSSTVSTDAFMQQVAQRTHAQQQVTVSTDSIRQFLFDLQRHGILRPVVDPWSTFALDGIRLGLLSPVAPAGWQHQLIWSSELPFIISTHVGGASKVAPVHLSQLAAAGFQRQWLREHLRALQRLA